MWRLTDFKTPGGLSGSGRRFTGAADKDGRGPDGPDVPSGFCEH